MSANKDQKRQNENPNDKIQSENKKQGFPTPGKNPKPFQKFTPPNKFRGNVSKSSSTFHRPTGK